MAKLTHINPDNVPDYLTYGLSHAVVADNGRQDRLPLGPGRLERRASTSTANPVYSWTGFQRRVDGSCGGLTRFDAGI